MDCGPACGLSLNILVKPTAWPFLRERSYITRSGVSLLGISEAAESIGLHTQGAKLTWEQLRNETPLPCIVHWKNNHFVVVYKIKKRRKFFSWFGKNDQEDTVFISDPAHGLLSYSKEEFLKCWLSSSQKQRILIARTVYKDPDYIFFDEATNSLDAKNERIIMENLNEFFKSRNLRGSQKIKKCTTCALF